MASDLTHHAVEYRSPPINNNHEHTTADGLKATIQELKDQGIKHVRIQWVDLASTIRCRVVRMSYFEKLLETNRPGTSLTKACLGIVFISMAKGFSPIGEYLYALDLSTLKVCPYAPGHASVMGWFEEKTPLGKFTDHRAVEVDLCPRTILRKVVEYAENTLGINFLMGFETEFILLKNTKPVEAVDNEGWCNASAFATGTKQALIMEQISDALEASGIELQLYHSEAAPGQYEVVTGPLPPLQAVDAFIHTRETIYNIASKHGLRATLAPRVFLDNCGNGAHAHISVHSAKPPQPSQHENLSSVEAAFLAGLLEHLPYIALLNLPIPASYKRMVDGVWSGGTYVCWGTDNREAPVRLANAASPSSRNFEVKTLDGTANPYLAMAGVLGAGLAGIEHSKELVIKDCGGETTAADMGEDARRALGITERLPRTWEDARSKFTKSVLVDRVFGENFKTKYLALNKTLKEQLSFGLMDEEEIKLLVECF